MSILFMSFASNIIANMIVMKNSRGFPSTISFISSALEANNNWTGSKGNNQPEAFAALNPVIDLFVKVSSFED